MKELVACFLIFLLPAISYACTPFWWDETYNFPSSLYYVHNPVQVYGGIDDSLVEDAFNQWVPRINEVSLATVVLSPGGKLGGNPKA
ncbi:MAG: hypothetical protein KOO60_00260 [Gemmatimonadales bacterium]|nr:hypothetical protein [Gemmatimonadales bacterium]